MRFSSRKAAKLIIVAVAAIAVMGFAACGDDESDDTNGDDTPVSDVTPADTPEDGAGSTPAMSFAEGCQKTGEKEFAEAPPQIIDTNKSYVATIATAKGNIVVELFSDVPITTNNFVFLACKGFYDGLTFHRVEPDFVIQGGDPTGTGAGGPGYTIVHEPDGDHVFAEGVLSMAHKGTPNTTGSQFFITIGLGPGGSLDYLDPDFAVFGEVTEGMDVAKKIAVGDVIDSITIEER